MTKLQKILAENVRKRREMIGMTREELAKKAGMSTSGMQRIEKGTRWPTASNIELVAHALGVTPWALFMPIER